MTRIAFVTDVHADVHALRDALAQIDLLGIETIVCCGDLLDYGVFVEETISLLRERRVACIRGNHDRWAVKNRHDMSGWDLTSRSIAWLECLPTTWSTVIDGIRIEAHHARPKSDMKGIDADAPAHELKAMLDDIAARVMIVGHTHVPFVRRLGRERLVCNPGALLRDAAPGVDVATPGTFGILGIVRGEAKFEIRRAANGEVVIAR